MATKTKDNKRKEMMIIHLLILATWAGDYAINLSERYEFWNRSKFLHVFDDHNVVWMFPNVANKRGDSLELLLKRLRMTVMDDGGQLHVF